MRYTTLVLSALAIVLMLTSSVHASGEINIYMFQSNDCSPCKTTDSIFENITTERDNIVLHKFDIDTDDGFEMWNRYISTFNLVENGYSIPLSIIGNDSITGTGSTTTEIENIISKYEAGTGGTIGDLVYYHPEKITQRWFYETYLKDTVIPNDTINVIVFTTPGCGPCGSLTDHIQSTIWDDKIKFRIIQGSDPVTEEGIYARYMEIAYMNAFQESYFEYPKVYVGNTSHYGYNEAYSNTIDELINSHLTNHISPSLTDAVYYSSNQHVESIAQRLANENGKMILTTDLNDEEMIIDPNSTIFTEQNQAKDSVSKGSIGFLTVFIMLFIAIVWVGYHYGYLNWELRS